MARAYTKKAPKVGGKFTGSQLFDAVGIKVGLKKMVVRDVIYALADVAVEQLVKTGLVRFPHLGVIKVKNIPAKSYPEGDYPNMFKRGPDGKPTMEHRPARIRPAKTKLKFNFASQLRKPVTGK